MPTTAEANTATNPKSGQRNDYKEMYSKSRPKALPSGVEAPDFTLRSTPDQWLALSEFRGQPVVLAFYPADWSPVCGDQMALYNEMAEGIPRARGGTNRNLGRWRLVPCRVRTRPQASFPPF